jgi:hypothetical protein
MSVDLRALVHAPMTEESEMPSRARVDWLRPRPHDNCSDAPHDSVWQLSSESTLPGLHSSLPESGSLLLLLWLLLGVEVVLEMAAEPLLLRIMMMLLMIMRWWCHLLRLEVDDSFHAVLVWSKADGATDRVSRELVRQLMHPRVERGSFQYGQVCHRGILCATSYTREKSTDGGYVDYPYVQHARWFGNIYIYMYIFLTIGGTTLERSFQAAGSAVSSWRCMSNIRHTRSISRRQ